MILDFAFVYTAYVEIMLNFAAELGTPRNYVILLGYRQWLILKVNPIKGTVPRDFLPLVFFFKLFLLGPVDMPRNDFDFFWLFEEILNFFGASPVSMTPVNNSSPVSMTPVSDTFTVLESPTGVNDTSKTLLTCVIDTGEACIHRCQWHRRSMYLPVSMTPAKHVTGVVDMHVFAGVVDTVDAPIRPLAVRQCL